MKKIAVFFPGVGYTVDRPLLYYTKMMAKQYDYEIVTLSYTGLPTNILGDSDKKKQSFMMALEQAEEVLNKINFDEYDDILFVSKSIGTMVAGTYTAVHQLNSRNIFFTPISETFDYVFSKGICFFGTNDPWADEKEMAKKCVEKGIKYYTINDTNHSLETGDVASDLTLLKSIMVKTERFIGDFE